jgi:hypothetical protein
MICLTDFSFCKAQYRQVACTLSIFTPNILNEKYVFELF